MFCTEQLIQTLFMYCKIDTHDVLYSENDSDCLLYCTINIHEVLYRAIDSDKVYLSHEVLFRAIDSDNVYVLYN